MILTVVKTGGSYLKMAWGAVASVGWYLVALSVVLWYVSSYFKEWYSNWKRKKAERDYAAIYHKDTDRLHERLSAVEASRQKMQEEYRLKALLAQQEEEERREQKKAETARLLEELGPKRLGSEDSHSRPSGSNPRALKQEYTPLSGDGSRGYRPPRRTRCRGGGCG